MQIKLADNQSMKHRRSRNTSDFRTFAFDRLSALKGCADAYGKSYKISSELRERFNVPGYMYSWFNGYSDCVRHQWERETEFRYQLNGEWKDAYALESEDYQLIRTLESAGNPPARNRFWKNTNVPFYAPTN